MPFQDIDEEVAPIPRVPSGAERWLHKVFLEDWGLKLLALAITIVLWMAVTGQNKPTTLRVPGVQLTFLKPDGLELSNDPPQSIDVTLRGSRDKLDRIGPRDLLATVDLSDQKPGERILKLTLQRVRMDLQEDVQVQGFHPATIPIRLEPIVEAQLEVEVKFEGKLPDGFELKSVSTSPARIRLRGPADRISALKRVTTETVWLDGRREPFDLSEVEINIPDPKIEILDPTVNIHGEIAPKRPELLMRFITGDDTFYLAGLTRPAHWL
jgi:YbbR domain-containing protein